MKCYVLFIHMEMILMIRLKVNLFFFNIKYLKSLSRNNEIAFDFSKIYKR